MTLKGHNVDPKQKVMPFWLLHRNSASDPRVRRMIDLRSVGSTNHARMADTLSARIVKIAGMISSWGTDVRRQKHVKRPKRRAGTCTITNVSRLRRE